MRKFDAETIADLVVELVGETEAYGDTYIDSVRVKNMQTMCDVIDSLMGYVYENTKYANRCEWSMKDIGMKAREFLGYLVVEYGLNDFVEEEEE